MKFIGPHGVPQPAWVTSRRSHVKNCHRPLAHLCPPLHSLLYSTCPARRIPHAPPIMSHTPRPSHLTHPVCRIPHTPPIASHVPCPLHPTRLARCIPHAPPSCPMRPAIASHTPPLLHPTHPAHRVAPCPLHPMHPAIASQRIVLKPFIVSLEGHISSVGMLVKKPGSLNVVTSGSGDGLRRRYCCLVHYKVLHWLMVNKVQ